MPTFEQTQTTEQIPSLTDATKDLASAAISLASAAAIKVHAESRLKDAESEYEDALIVKLKCNNARARIDNVENTLVEDMNALNNAQRRLKNIFDTSADTGPVQVACKEFISAAFSLTLAATTMDAKATPWVRITLAQAATNLALNATKLYEAPIQSPVKAIGLAQEAANIVYVVNTLYDTSSQTQMISSANRESEVCTPDCIPEILRMIECRENGNDECPKRKVIRELIMNEITVHNNHRNFFAAVQGLLWTAAGVFVQSDVRYRNAACIMVSVVGFLFSAVTGFFPHPSKKSAVRLLEALPDPYWPTPVTGRFLEELTTPLWQYECSQRLNDFDVVVPFICGIVWISFILVILIIE